MPQNALAKEYLNMSNSAHILDCHTKPAWLAFRQIIVLDHGRIIERGSHDELIEQKGTYYQLYTGAFELE